MPLSAELSFVLALVHECGALARTLQRHGPDFLKIRDKPRGGGPVTTADLEIDRRIVTALRRRFPDDAIVAEESEPAVYDTHWRIASRCWYVDPIDGTREFALGRDGWTIQIGLCIAGRPVLGIVHEPATYRMSWAIDVPGGPRQAWHRIGAAAPRPLVPSDAPISAMTLIGGRSLPLSPVWQIRRALGVPDARMRTVGSIGVRMAAVARGDADAYVQPPGPTKTWDTCAPAVLLTGCGAVVTDLLGRPLSYRSAITHPAGVVASHGRHHAEILERLAPLAQRWLR